MSYRMAKLLFLVGTLSSLVLFLVLTVDTQSQIQVLTNADKIDQQVIAGKKVFEKYNCNDCHTILGFGGYYAPDLTRVYWRHGEEGIRLRLTHPETAFKDSPRKMPQLNLSPDEVTAAIHFFKWVSEIDNHEWPPQDKGRRPSSSTRRLVMDTGLSQGAALFKTKGCITCHKLGGVGGSKGGDMDGIGLAHDRQELEDIIRDPRSFDPDTLMPKTVLTENEIKALVDFLSRQR